ncbi:hypothetical protein H7H98_03745 [Mycolicibacterium sphagni]|nr:hypothetical protein [Mycolicibacterium sphagni]
MNSKAKRKLRRWVLAEFGDGTTAPCAMCGCLLTIDTLTLDHYPIPACLFGHLTESNVRPACGPCNAEDGKRLDREYAFLTREERRLARRRILEQIAAR